MKTRKHNEPGQTGSAEAPVASFRAGSGAKNKKRPGGRRKPLIRLDSAKESQGFSLLDFVRALLDEAQIWLNLDLARKKLGFPSGGTGLSSPRSWRTP
jgi:hypothetical protein